MSASMTLRRLLSASLPPSWVTSILVPDGSVLLMSSITSRTLFATDTVLASRERVTRSEEHTSELQSHSDLVCRLLLEKKNKIERYPYDTIVVRTWSVRLE